MKMIFKNFTYVLKRFKISSILNILGLSAAFSVFLILMVQAHYDLSFDRNFKDADKIYLMTYYSPFNDNHVCWINTQVGDNNISKSTLVESYTSISNEDLRFYSKESNPETAISEPILRVRGDFISVFQPTVLEGNLADALSEGNNLALSESVAKRLFGAESAIGKTVISYYDKQPYTIRAVLKDFPKNCSLPNGLFAYLPEQPKSESSFNLYMKINPENKKRFDEYLKSDNFWGEGVLKQMEDNPEQKAIASAIPLTDIHLKFSTMGKGDLNITLSLIAIAILTLIIAYINFVNFSIAMAPSRVKTLTIQRIYGLGKNKQIGVIAIESAIFSFVAFFIALIIINLVDGSSISQLFSANISIINTSSSLIIGGLVAILIGFSIGIYPAKYITQFDVIEALKGTSATVKASKLRSVLITFQFIAAITLIIVTFFIKIQYDYMVNYSWGIHKENIVYMDIGKKGINYKSFTDELLKDPRIKDYTLSQFVPGHIYMGWMRNFNGKQIQLKSWPVADNYLEFFGATMIAGDDFTKLNNPEKVKIIFNEELLRKYDFTVDDVLGKEFQAFETPAQVVGIVKDINFENLKVPIQPMAFVTLGDSKNSTLFLKLSGVDTKEVIQLIESTWTKHSKETLDLQFLDQTLEKLYRTENDLGKLVGFFSVITILIAVMGVYGLIAFNIKYRKKEIAIRKINGANEAQIVKILNEGMIFQLIIGFVIASPLAYYIVNKWLSNFAYRSEIHWWVFPLSGMLVFLIAVISISWQSYRAATTNPVKSLKSE